MSEEPTTLDPVEVVRSIVVAWERADYSVDERWAHLDIEWAFVDGPAPGSGTGFDALAETWSDFLDTWETLGVEVEEYRELDSDRVLVLFELSVRGRSSGAEVRTISASVFTLCEGKVARLDHYTDRGAALADLGLEE
jgi:ketosteroid isomerase-like protein